MQNEMWHQIIKIWNLICVCLIFSFIVVRDWKVINPLLCKIILWKAWLMIMTVSEINDNERTIMLYSREKNNQFCSRYRFCAMVTVYFDVCSKLTIISSNILRWPCGLLNIWMVAITIGALYLFIFFNFQISTVYDRQIKWYYEINDQKYIHKKKDNNLQWNNGQLWTNI
jgi:hypothetical protein